MITFMKKISWCLPVAILAGVAPTSVFGHSYGPAPRVTGAPGDNARACTACHTTSALNSGTGSVKIVLQSGALYIPGVRQRVTVQVEDPDQRRWGFEFSARLSSDAANKSAGDLSSVDNLTQVICEDNGPKPCATAVSFITHTSAGSRNGLRGGASFQFDWTPPAADAGPVTFYVAGNAANGDGSPGGDLIYTSSVQLTPAIPAAPTIAADGIVSAATSIAGPVSPNSWVSIYGSNLSVTTRGWNDTDFINGAIPFSLDGVSVMLNLFGAPRLAYVGYVSPNQVNFLIPSDLSITATTVQLRNSAGKSTAVPITIQANAAQLFTPDGKAVLATHANGTLIGKSSPAAPGETISLYATGLGPTSPAQIPGQLPAQSTSLAAAPQVTIAGNAATVPFAGVVAGSAGLYQVNVQVPSGAANGDLPLILQVGTANSQLLLTVQKP